MIKVVLGYSGGLDTSVLVRLLKDHYHAAVITATIDIGQDEPLEDIRAKAMAIGAAEAVIIDAGTEFADDYIAPSLKANAMYENVYPLATALARPLIARHLVTIARHTGAEFVAHGCTAKGNDQVRFELALAMLDPSIKILAPLRELRLTRHQELEYARQYGIPVEEKSHSYSIDENLWGRSIECGALEDEDREPPSDVFDWVRPAAETPDYPCELEIGFDQGQPVSLNREPLSKFGLIKRLNQLGGEYGVGMVDHIESRLVGIKSREIYEAPAAAILIKAHQDLEKITLTRDVLHFKPIVELAFADLVYNGLWFTPLRRAISSFIDEIQKDVTGWVRMKLYKGSSRVVGRKAERGLYSKDLATYQEASRFDDDAASGFINIWSLPYRFYSQVHKIGLGDRVESLSSRRQDLLKKDEVPA